MAARTPPYRSMLWHLVVVVVVFLLVVFPVQMMTQASSSSSSEEMTCEADDDDDDNDGTCSSSSSNSDLSNMEQVVVPPPPPPPPNNVEFRVQIVNKSAFRADVYWDDGRLGKMIATVEKNGGSVDVYTFRDHRFFFTRHGVKEGLFDPDTDTQHRFQAFQPDEMFVIPESAAPSTNMCQDRFSVCEQYSQNGGCWNSPGWMIVHCCKSCDKDLNAAKVIDPKIRCTKENLNITTESSAWQPGDLNKLFTSWATDDDKFAVYEPQVLSSPDGAYGGASGPWVVTFDKFFTSEEADAMIRGGELVGFDRSTNQGAMNRLGEMEKVVSTTRTSSNAWCIRECEKMPEIDAITGRIESVTGVPRKHYENFQILEYEHNQFYRMHHDSRERDERPAGPRIMTFFLYLSDVEEGGETYFNKLDLAVRPKKGRALVWPSVMDDDPEFWDQRMYHEAKDVIKGKKYAANHWIHLNDFIGPNQWGCTGSFS